MDREDAIAKGRQCLAVYRLLKRFNLLHDAEADESSYVRGIIDDYKISSVEFKTGESTDAASACGGKPLGPHGEDRKPRRPRTARSLDPAIRNEQVEFRTAALQEACSTLALQNEHQTSEMSAMEEKMEALGEELAKVKSERDSLRHLSRMHPSPESRSKAQNWQAAGMPAASSHGDVKGSGANRGQEDYKIRLLRLEINRLTVENMRLQRSVEDAQKSQ